MVQSPPLGLIPGPKGRGRIAPCAHSGASVLTCSSPAPALLVRPAGWGRRAFCSSHAPLPPVRRGCRRGAGVEHGCMSWAHREHSRWAQCPEAAGSDLPWCGRPSQDGGAPVSAWPRKGLRGGGAALLSLSLSLSLFAEASFRVRSGALLVVVGLVGLGLHQPGPTLHRWLLCLY